MSGYNFEIKGIDNFLKDINNIQNNFYGDLENLIKKHGVSLFTKTKMKTPVDTGQLRRSWQLKYKKGDLYIRLYNNTEYGIYVEQGHRTRGGKSYVEGAYMLKKTFEKTEKKFIEDLEKLFKKYGFKQEVIK